MKKRLLLILPALALLTGCGETDPMDSVRQSLPNDVEVVDQEKEEGAAEEYYCDAFGDLLNIDEDRIVYDLSLDLTVSASGKIDEFAYNGFTSIKGDFKFGFETVYGEEEEPFSSAFVMVSNFSINANLNLPAEIKEEMPIPETVSLSNVDFYAYFTETSEGAYAYIDLSNHAIQDYIYKLAKDNGYESYADIVLNSLLGNKIEGTNYRPGLVKINVSELISDIDSLDTSADHKPIPEIIVKKPLTYYLTIGKNSAATYGKMIGNFAEDFFTMLNPFVGVKYGESEDPSEMVELEKISVVINIRSSDIATNFEIPAEEMPVNGVVGLLVSVGMGNGSENYALEEFKLSVNVSGKIEETNFSAVGSLNLSALYNDQTELVAPSIEQAESYSDITNPVFALYQMIKAMQSQPQK